MTKAQELFNGYLKSVEELKSIKDFYEYEKQFVALHEQLGRQMLEQSLGDKKHRSIKKIQTRYGEVALCTSHCFANPGNGFKISPYLQNLLLATTAESPY